MDIMIWPASVAIPPIYLSQFRWAGVGGLEGCR